MNQQTLCILGRQSELGLAELESLYGPDVMQPVGHGAVLIDCAPDSIRFDRLGGVIKVCSVESILQDPTWPNITSYLKASSEKYMTDDNTGKITFGLSVYGIDVTPKEVLATGLELKKSFKAAKQSFRLVPNQKIALNSAQVLHNRLLHGHNAELVFLKDGNRVICGRTVQVQDIDAYSSRDYSRPHRDSRVGMLPPKLAQIIINLAAGTLDTASTVLDPFCGTGVVLQEAGLMGFLVYGTDIDERMLTYSQQNLAWLGLRTGVLALKNPRLELGDATNMTWQKPFDTIASELYLGRAFNHMPTHEELESNRTNCGTITEKFLHNLWPQIKSGDRLCLAVPTWQTRPGVFLHLPLLEHLEQLGYNRVSFRHTHNQDLIYARPNQVVCRELLIVTRK